MEEYRIDPTIAYDVVELPSRGIHYASKKKSFKVAYLTAADENILSAQNLIQSSGVVTELLKRKILDRDIQFEEIVEEDKEAVLIFLRNTAWGSDYTMNLVDPKTKDPFVFTADLSTIKIKPFNLVSDANGEYSFFLPKTKAEITFKFATQVQEEELNKIKTSWNGQGVAPIVTKRLEMMIKSIAGNRDMMQIHNLIENMPIKDSQDFRKFINENKPGLDLTQTVRTPSGEDIQIEVGFGVEFFRPFYGL
jgi:hypothetical protein